MQNWLAKKLTRSKSVPLTDEQIRRHREQRDHRDQWQADVAALAQIVDRIRTQYAQHKGDFAIGRYEELKTMVKEAVQQTKAVSSDNKERRQTATGGSGTGRAATMTGLRDEAANFAKIQQRVKSDEKKYSEMSVSELEAETEKLRRQVIQLKAEYRTRRDRLETLATSYETSKQLNPAQRYPALKDMIKDVCEELPKPSK